MRLKRTIRLGLMTLFGVWSSFSFSEQYMVEPKEGKEIDGGTAAVYFNSIINYASISELIYIINGINIMHPKINNIYLYISSDGGDIDAAFSAYSVIRSSHIPITTVGIAKVQSAATFLHCAGAERMSVDETVFYYHRPVFRTDQAFDREVLNEKIDDIKITSEQLKKIYSTCTNFTDAEMEGFLLMEANRVVLKPKQALERKIISNILDRLPNPTLSYIIYQK